MVTVIWFQVTNNDNPSKQLELQVTILNTNNLHTVICFQVTNNNNNP